MEEDFEEMKEGLLEIATEYGMNIDFSQLNANMSDLELRNILSEQMRKHEFPDGLPQEKEFPSSVLRERAEGNLAN